MSLVGQFSPFHSMSEDTAKYSKEPCEELHRIGDQELYTPDYRLVCAWAEQCKLEPEEVLRRLLKPTSDDAITTEITTEIVAGKFKSIAIDYLTFLPVTELPDTGELIIEKLSLIGGKLTTLDLRQVPKLTELECFGNQLTELDLSQVPNLTKLGCHANALTELDLRHVPELTILCCTENQLTELDLSQVPKLTILGCAHNQIKELDLSQVPNLTKLHAMYNQLTELDLSHAPGLTELECLRNQLTNLDITPLHSLKSLKHDKDKTKLIQRPDQNL